MSGPAVDPHPHRWRIFWICAAVAAMTILDLSKVEAGKMDVVAAPVSLRDVCSDAASTFRPLAEQRGLALAADPLPTTLAYAELLQRLGGAPYAVAVTALWALEHGDHAGCAAQDECRGAGW